MNASLDDLYLAEYLKWAARIPAPRAPLDDDAIDPNDTTRNPPRDTDE